MGIDVWVSEETVLVHNSEDFVKLPWLDLELAGGIQGSYLLNIL
jgi:hypothetical protein